MDTEGNFLLVAEVAPTADKPGRWTAYGLVRLRDAVEPVERILAGDSFETRQVAQVAAIEAARQLASTRVPAPADTSAPGWHTRAE